MTRLVAVLALLAAVSLVAMWLVLHEMSDREPLLPGYEPGDDEVGG